MIWILPVRHHVQEHLHGRFLQARRRNALYFAIDGGQVPAPRRRDDNGRRRELSRYATALRGRSNLKAVASCRRTRSCPPPVISKPSNCAPGLDIAQQTTPGQMTFMESIFVLDRNPKSLGYDRSIVFYNLTERFRYQTPDQAIDVDSGVLCCPNHFQYETPLSEGILRLTNQANYDYWNGLIRKDYIAAKRM